MPLSATLQAAAKPEPATLRSWFETSGLEKYLQDVAAAEGEAAQAIVIEVPAIRSLQPKPLSLVRFSGWPDGEEVWLEKSSEGMEIQPFDGAPASIVLYEAILEEYKLHFDDRSKLFEQMHETGESLEGTEFRGRDEMPVDQDDLIRLMEEEAVMLESGGGGDR